MTSGTKGLSKNIAITTQQSANSATKIKPSGDNTLAELATTSPDVLTFIEPI
jgi:hypothetical protein